MSAYNGFTQNYQRDQTQRERAETTHSVSTCDVSGLDNAGKTTILKKFMGEDTSEIAPTLGFNIETLEHDDCKLNVWDVGGQTTIRSYWRNYFEATDGLIWVVDSGDKMRIEDCKEELQKLLEQEKLAGATLLIFCNKQDCEGALTVEQIGEVLEIDKIDKRHYNIQACSGITGDGLLEGMQWMVDDIKS